MTSSSFNTAKTKAAITMLQSKKDPTHFRALRSQIHASAFNLKKVMCGQGVLSLDDTKAGMDTQVGASNLPIFNQPDLRHDLETYLDIVTDYTQQTKQGLEKIATEKPK